VVVGAGGFGRETLDVLEAVNHRSGQSQYVIQGVADDSPSDHDLEILLRRGIEYLGSTADVLNLCHSNLRYLIAIGNPESRRFVDRKFKDAGFLATSAVHPTAVVGSNFQMEAGVVICAGVQISTNVSLGAHVHINPGAIIGHDAQLSDYVSVNPGAIVSGHVQVKPRALLGAGAIVLQGLTVGEGSLVGAGAVAVRNVPKGSVVKGVPAT
jgi:sugar O-acyltransferase (sialic acid O-acetyltransferase NeuD family)